MTQTGEKHDVLQLGKSPTTSPSACDVGDGVGLAIGGRVVAPGNAKSIRRATQSGSRASPSATSKTGADQVHRAQYCRGAGHRHRTQTLVLRSVSAARRQRTEGGGRIDAKAPASGGVSADAQKLHPSTGGVPPDRHWDRCSGSDQPSEDNKRPASAGPDLLCLHLRHRANRRRNEGGDKGQRKKASCSRVDDSTCGGAKRTARYLTREQGRAQRSRIETVRSRTYSPSVNRRKEANR